MYSKDFEGSLLILYDFVIFCRDPLSDLPHFDACRMRLSMEVGHLGAHGGPFG